MASEIDAALREAIYFEALKEYEAEEAATRTDEIIAALIALLLAKGYTSFVSVKKTEMNKLMIDVRKSLLLALDKTEAAFIERMQTVLEAALTSTRGVNEFAAKKKITHIDFTGAKAANKRLWTRVTKETVPAAGLTLSEMLKDFRRGVVNQMTIALKRAYVDNWTMTDLMAFLKGSKERNFKDGAMNKLSNQFRSVTRTFMAHMKSWLAYEVGNLLYPTYQWISTIDSATTPICRSRHLKIYEYGRGPRPPAHYNCRSIIVGMIGNLANQLPRSYWDWIRSQPAEFLRDVLLPAEATAVSNGTATAAQFPVYRNVRRLSPEQFGKRLPLMIG
jgi:SPP1 gp7 family putative phage head morphogenesis protein